MAFKSLRFFTDRFRVDFRVARMTLLVETANVAGDVARRFSRRFRAKWSAFTRRLEFALTPSVRGTFEDHGPNQMLFVSPTSRPESKRNEEIDGDQCSIVLRLSAQNLPGDPLLADYRIHVFVDESGSYMAPKPVTTEVPTPEVPDSAGADVDRATQPSAPELGLPSHADDSHGNGRFFATLNRMFDGATLRRALTGAVADDDNPRNPDVELGLLPLQIDGPFANESTVRFDLDHQNLPAPKSFARSKNSLGVNVGASSHDSGVHNRLSWPSVIAVARMSTDGQAIKRRAKSVAETAGILPHQMGRWKEIAVTERVLHSLSPRFETTIRLDFTLGDLRTLRFIVAESGPGKGKVMDDTIIGWIDLLSTEACFGTSEARVLNISLPTDMIEATLSALVAGENAQVGVATPPTLTIMPLTAVESLSGDAQVTFSCRAEGLADTDLIGKTEAYFAVFKALSDPMDVETDVASEWLPVFKSEVAQPSINPRWNEFTVELDQLSSHLKFEVYDYERLGRHDLIGVTQVTLAEINGTAAVRELVHPKRKLMFPGTYQNSGVLVFESVRMEGVERTFASYLAQGTQLGLSFAVDFGLGNLNRTDPSSLHFRHPKRNVWNPETLSTYERIMIAMGRALAAFDDSHLVAGLGFGARIKTDAGDSVLSQCFNLNGDRENPLCSGIYGLLNAYDLARNCVDFWGPVAMSDVIKRFVSAATQMQQMTPRQPTLDRYSICVVLTYGSVVDLGGLPDLLRQCETLPLSIVVVYLGPPGEGEELKRLEDVLLPDGEACAQRQFLRVVDWNDFKGDASFSDLTKAAFSRIPKDFIAYAQTNKLVPPNETFGSV